MRGSFRTADMVLTKTKLSQGRRQLWRDNPGTRMHYYAKLCQLGQIKGGSSSIFDSPEFTRSRGPHPCSCLSYWSNLASSFTFSIVPAEFRILCNYCLSTLLRRACSLWNELHILENRFDRATQVILASRSITELINVTGRSSEILEPPTTSTDRS